MGYGNQCLITPAISGEAKAVALLPKSEIPGSVATNGDVPYCRIHYTCLADRSSPEITCRLRKEGDRRMTTKIDVYLSEILIRGGSYPFYNTWVPDDLTEPGSGLVPGTLVGSLIYDGRGHWVGEISHPQVPHPLYVKIMARNCQATTFVGQYGPSPDDMPLQIATVPGPWYLPTAIYAMDAPLDMYLGDTWFIEDDWGGAHLADGCPFTFAPPYQRGMPTNFLISGGMWGDIMNSGEFGFLEHEETCLFYDSGFFEGSAPIFWLVKIEDNPLRKSLKPQLWRWTQTTDECRTLFAGEKGWAQLSRTDSALAGIALQVGWGTVDDAYFFPISSTSIFGRQGGFRRYFPAPPYLTEDGIPVGNNPEGGYDWLKSAILQRGPYSILEDRPSDEELEPWSDYAPDQLTLSPDLTCYD